MPDKKSGEKNIRKLMRMGKNGGSVGLTLPVDIIRQLGWKERQKVIVNLRGKNIIIKDWEK